MPAVPRSNFPLVEEPSGYQWVPDLDLGDGHTLKWLEWLPDLELNPQYRDVPPVGPGEHFGALIHHPPGPNVKQHTLDFFDGWCLGGIRFHIPTTAALHQRDGEHGALWDVQSWDPLTISPSVLCDCGDHGFVRDGRWVRA